MWAREPFALMSVSFKRKTRWHIWSEGESSYTVNANTHTHFQTNNQDILSLKAFEWLWRGIWGSTLGANLLKLAITDKLTNWVDYFPSQLHWQVCGSNLPSFDDCGVSLWGSVRGALGWNINRQQTCYCCNYETTHVVKLIFQPHGN